MMRRTSDRLPALAARVLVLMLLVALSGMLWACDPASPSGSTDEPGTPDGTTADGTTPAPGDGTAETAGPRIISLTPAITQMLTDMGKRSQIVGVSSVEDDTIDLPRCGTYNDPLVSRILELAPDIVLTESGLGDVPPMLRAMADNGAFELHTIPHSLSVGDVEKALIDPRTGLGQAVGDPAAAERARRLMATRLDLVSRAVADTGRPAPRVLMLINPTRLGAIGTGVTHDQLLTLAHASNVAGAFDIGYVTLSRTQVQQMRPDVILIFEPGGVAIMDNDPRLRVFEGMDIPAVTNKRIVVIRHRQSMLPSTTIPAVLVEMCCAIYPDRAAQVREAYGMAQQVIERADNRTGAAGAADDGGGS